jgi:hypothetical protein
MLITKEYKMKINELFTSIDKMDSKKFISFLTEDVIFKFGNFPESVGKEEIKKSVDNFFSTISDLSHKIEYEWKIDDILITEGIVTYTRKNNSKISIPFVNVFRLQNNLIKKYQIYIDINPLYN